GGAGFVSGVEYSAYFFVGAAVLVEYGVDFVEEDGDGSGCDHAEQGWAGRGDDEFWCGDQELCHFENAGFPAAGFGGVEHDTWCHVETVHDMCVCTPQGECRCAMFGWECAEPGNECRSLVQDLMPVGYDGVGGWWVEPGEWPCGCVVG